MRKRFVSVVGGMCLLGLVSGTVIANAGGANITAPETITVLGTTTKDRYVDVGKPGSSPGDVIVFVERLTDEADDSVLGKGRIQCTVHVGPWAICIGTFDFTGRGEIVGEGIGALGDDAVSFDVPVTGGTGDFTNVRGEVHIEPVSDGVERETFELSPKRRRDLRHSDRPGGGHRATDFRGIRNASLSTTWRLCIPHWGNQHAPTTTMALQDSRAPDRRPQRQGIGM